MLYKNKVFYKLIQHEVFPISVFQNNCSESVRQISRSAQNRYVMSAIMVGVRMRSDSAAPRSLAVVSQSSRRRDSRLTRSFGCAYGVKSSMVCAFYGDST